MNDCLASSHVDEITDPVEILQSPVFENFIRKVEQYEAG